MFYKSDKRKKKRVTSRLRVVFHLVGSLKCWQGQKESSCVCKSSDGILKELKSSVACSKGQQSASEIFSIRLMGCQLHPVKETQGCVVFVCGSDALLIKDPLCAQFQILQKHSSSSVLPVIRQTLLGVFLVTVAAMRPLF